MVPTKNAQNHVDCKEIKALQEADTRSVIIRICMSTGKFADIGPTHFRLRFIIECFLTNSKSSTLMGVYRATRKCLYLKKYLFATNRTFIFVFNISNLLIKYNFKALSELGR